ncbi:MAG: hypothetical protein RLZZ09_2159, partial [Pseudomonadota bacterium]
VSFILILPIRLGLDALGDLGRCRAAEQGHGVANDHQNDEYEKYPEEGHGVSFTGCGLTR